MGKRRIILTHNSKVGGFDKMLKQVFPSSIPQQYVDKLIITTNDGNISESFWVAVLKLSQNVILPRALTGW